MPSSQYRKSHYGDKTILLPCYLRNEISYIGKLTSLYWIMAQAVFVHILHLAVSKKPRNISTSAYYVSEFVVLPPCIYVGSSYYEKKETIV